MPEAIALLIKETRELRDLIQSKRSPEVVECERLNLNEAVELTGYSKSSIYKGLLPYKKMGKKLVFSRKELVAWMENQTVKPVSNNSIVLTAIAESASKKANL
ncbi:MAG: helix-turn-helix domain-containing protein [Bacteroidales bacterium]